MRIGIMIGATGGDDGLDALISLAKDIEAKGLDNVWMANIFTFDAVSALSVIGHRVPRIGLGTAVTPTYPRHPTALAQQALTAAAASGNRFVMGIGLSHKVVIENMLGFSYDKPARHMREYLSVLMPLLRGETVNYDGEQFKVHNVTLRAPGAKTVPVVVAALGPAMLKITGELADGTSTWMTGPKTLEKHVVATISKAAQGAGRPAPMVVGGFPIVLTNKPDDAKAFISKSLATYGVLPSYRAMLDREGAAGPADIAMAGDEKALRAQLTRLRDIGVTDFNAAVVSVEPDSFARTLGFLADVRSGGGL